MFGGLSVTMRPLRHSPFPLDGTKMAGMRMLGKWRSLAVGVNAPVAQP
jgi:hypothetical protein